MNFQIAEAVLREHGYKFFYCRMLSGRCYEDPDGTEVFLSESEVIQLAEELKD